MHFKLNIHFVYRIGRSHESVLYCLFVYRCREKNAAVISVGKQADSMSAVFEDVRLMHFSRVTVFLETNKRDAKE